MKRILSGIALLLLASGSANASLVSRAGGQAYYDTVLNITWVADANLADTNAFGVSGIGVNGDLSWTKSNEWIAAMNSAAYLGRSDWRLPTVSQPDPNCTSQANPGFPHTLQGQGFGCTNSEMAHLFLASGISAYSWGPFTNVQSGPNWSGTEYAPDPSHAWSYHFDFGLQQHLVKNTTGWAWAARSGDIAAVPVPPAVWLFGSALGLMGVMRRKIAS